MSENLRLSILLDPIVRTEIASIIDYPRPINKYTRILHYYHVQREEDLPKEAEKAQKCFKPLIGRVNATHIITGVTYGINIIAILQLPSDAEIASKIDNALDTIRFCLNDDNTALIFNEDTENLLAPLEEVIHTMVYTNIVDVTPMTTLRDVCYYIDQNKNETINSRMAYTLRPIKWIYPKYNGSEAKFAFLPSKYNGKLEQCLIDLLNTVKNLKYSLDIDVTKALNGYLEKQLREAQGVWLNLNKAYESAIKRLKQIVIDIRCGQADIYKIDEALKSDNHLGLNELMNKLTKQVADLEAKGKFIARLEQQDFKYCDVTECKIYRGDNDQRLEQKLIKNSQRDRILCCNDIIRRKNESELNRRCNELVAERSKNPDLNLIYADFSYCLYDLRHMKIMLSKKQENNENVRKPKPSRLSRKRKTANAQSRKTKSATPSSTDENISNPLLLSSSPSVTDEVINILLLGESGVGKSTFINAFVNYLTFETFEQAQSQEPVVLIPVSFLMTTGHNFEERIVTFGDFESTKNEDYDHPGESVTQHCKSYMFDLNHNDGRKLCIIDTPGFGDTRGLDQDDRNMQDILDYINNLTHLNAVCFLLKSNASQLNKFFRICLTQLFDLLGSNISQNIIFCFTNARSTFYNPGDTAPLLKETLKSFSMTDIFKKENTFCFDNESFRYLVALRNSIKFDNDETDEYKMSWSTSVNESDRLLDYISTQLSAYPIHNELKSIKQTEIEIVHIIQPMLEAMRNILRNIILCKMGFPKKSIRLYPKAIHRIATVCPLCKPYPIQVGNFWVVRDIPHEFLKKCLACSCAADEHVPINYVLNYEYLDSPSSYQQSEMNQMVQKLFVSGAEFDYFLTHIAHLSKGNPFWTGLKRMITEEEDLCKEQKPNYLNVQLVKELTVLKNQYKDRITDLKSNHQQIELTLIYKFIKDIREYPMVKEQVKAIETTQTVMTELYKVPDD